MYAEIVLKVIDNKITRGKIVVSKQTNDRSDTEREGVAYVYVWILLDKYKTAKY